MPVTERLILPVQNGADWKEPLKFLLQTLKKQDGNIRTRWGPHSENVDNLELLIGEFITPFYPRPRFLTEHKVGSPRPHNKPSRTHQLLVTSCHSSSPFFARSPLYTLCNSSPTHRRKLSVRLPCSSPFL